ncbi:unnamed protein product [Tenebrio molitor]|nr:unnamed protein product [Tenebrio molitor]
MEHKKYGVDISLITQLKNFQLSLRSRKTMVFLGMVNVSFTGAGISRMQVQVRDRRISFIPSVIKGCELPR